MKFINLLLLLLLTKLLPAQLVVSNGATPTALVNSLLGTGVTVSNVTFQGVFNKYRFNASIAAAVGYETAPPLLRHYRAEFGLSPTEDRNRINRFRVEDNRPLPSP